MSDRTGSPYEACGEDRPRDPAKRATLKTLVGLGLLTAVEVVGLASCGRRGSGRSWSRRAERPNIILITVDTTRGDHLSCYATTGAKTPYLDWLAASGIIYRRAYSNIPITAPSHASILTGLYPRTHGVRNNMDKLADDFSLLPELLRPLGYRSAAFVSVHFLKAKNSNLDKGFDDWDEDFRDAKCPSYREAWIVTRQATRWLDAHGADQPFFLWLHYFDPHGPYEPPPPYDSMYCSDYAGRITGETEWLQRISNGTYIPTEDDLRHLLALYDGEITYMDMEIGRFVYDLRDRGLYDDSVVLLMADHGQEFCEHAQLIGHAGILWDTALHIPLVLKLPGNRPAGIEVATAVESVDAVPTILDYLGQGNGDLPGRSLLACLDEDEADPERVIVSETFAPEGGASFAALREGDKKVIVNDEHGWRRFYDLRSDRGETQDLYSADNADAQALVDELKAWQSQVVDGPEQTAELDAESKRILRSLGYVR